MNSFKNIVLLLVVLSIGSCKKNQKLSAEDWVNASIKSHRMDDFNNKKVAFSFREFNYTQNKDAQGIIYTRSKKQSPEQIDVLHSKNGFSRTLNNEPVILSDSLASVYSESVNSVLYFFRLPFSLKDTGAIKTELKSEQIKNRLYQKIGVSFTPENGGVDYQDTFRYWIDKETKKLDYLAYQYHSDGGGIRFRAVVNRRTIGGVVFQDYENYKAPKNSSLDELTDLYKKEKLELISMIINDSIRIVKP